jgi:hypothetical protein
VVAAASVASVESDVAGAAVESDPTELEPTVLVAPVVAAGAAVSALLESLPHAVRINPIAPSAMKQRERFDL